MLKILIKFSLCKQNLKSLFSFNFHTELYTQSFKSGIFFGSKTSLVLKQ